MNPRIVLSAVAVGLCLAALSLLAPAASAESAPAPLCSSAANPSGPTDNCTVWHNYAVVLNWSWDRTATKQTQGCDTQTFTAETPPPGVAATCTAAGFDGQSVATTAYVRIDLTPPTAASATPNRPPDAGGFYNHPVAFSFAGTDPVSGIASCTTTTYAGPDGAPTSVSGTCRDNAGNVSPPLAVPVRYKATPPSLTKTSARASDTVVRLAWTASADATAIAITRQGPGGGARMVYRGLGTSFLDRGLHNGTIYRYTLTVSDAADNSRQTTVLARPVPDQLTPLGRSSRVAAVVSPPVLRWAQVRGAQYYNVQLYRSGRKILSSWPSQARFQLQSNWVYNGRVRFGPGSYRWFVWPGYGPRSDHRYGQLLGRGAFRVKSR